MYSKLYTGRTVNPIRRIRDRVRVDGNGPIRRAPIAARQRNPRSSRQRETAFARVTREQMSGATPWPWGVRVALLRDFSYDFQAGASWKNLGNLKAGAFFMGAPQGSSVRTQATTRRMVTIDLQRRVMLGHKRVTVRSRMNQYTRFAG